MKITRKEIGTEVFITKWHRGFTNTEEVESRTITSVGSVYIGLDGRKYKIYDDTEFRLSVSEGHYSDHNVQIYRNLEDIYLHKNKVVLEDEVERKLRKVGLSLAQLTAINDIIRGS